MKLFSGNLAVERDVLNIILKLLICGFFKSLNKFRSHGKSVVND